MNQETERGFIDWLTRSDICEDGTTTRVTGSFKFSVNRGTIAEARCPPRDKGSTTRGGYSRQLFLVNPATLSGNEIVTFGNRSGKFLADSANFRQFSAEF